MTFSFLLRKLLLVLLLVLGYILLFPPDLSFSTLQAPLYSPSSSLSSFPYETRVLTAPVATGVLLESIAFLLTGTRVGPFLRRSLLNANGFETMRALAEQYPGPPLYFPVRRLSPEEFSRHEEEANQAESLLRTPLSELPSVEVGFRTVSDYAKQYAAGHQLPSDVAARVLKEIKNFEERGLHIFVEVNEDEVMAQAKASDLRHQGNQSLGIFDGVLVAVKDMLPIRGHRLCHGQHSSSCELQEEDDPVIQRFRKAGAIILGSTIMTEGGVTPLGYSAHYSGPFSAYSPFHYSGGSSSGSAVAVATGLVPVAIGFDGGGSIRIPASMSGTHGLGATFGRIANTHTSSTMIKAGPMTTNALDAALTFELLAPQVDGHFYTELYGGAFLPTPHTGGFNDVDDLSDVRLGYFEEWFFDSDPRVANLCRKSIAALEERGATLVPINIPHLHWLAMAHSMKISSEFALAFDYEYHHNFDFLEPNTKVTVGIGKSFSALEVLAAEKLRRFAFDYLVNEIFGALNVTAIVNPTIGVLPPRIPPGAKRCGESNSQLVVQLMKYIFLGNLVGLPGYSVPVGYIDDTVQGSAHTGPLLPIGLHFLGNHWRENDLLRLGHVVDLIFGRERVRPPYFVDVLPIRKKIGHWSASADTVELDSEGNLLSPQMV